MMIAINIIVILVILGLVYLTIKKSKGVKRIIILAVIGVVSGFGFAFEKAIFLSRAQMLYGIPNSLTQVEVINFNAKWESYEGQQKGSSVKSIISSIITNNITYEQDEPNKTISLNEKIKSADLMEERNKIVSGKLYNVELEYEKGLVHAITVTEIENSVE